MWQDGTKCMWITQRIRLIQSLKLIWDSSALKRFSTQFLVSTNGLNLGEEKVPGNLSDRFAKFARSMHRVFFKNSCLSMYCGPCLPKFLLWQPVFLLCNPVIGCRLSYQHLANIQKMITSFINWNLILNPKCKRMNAMCTA